MSTANVTTPARRRRSGRARTSNHAAIEAFYPGVVCKWMEYRASYTWPGKYDVEFMVEASAEILITHGLTTRAEVESLPPCGVRHSLRRTKRGRFQVKRYVWDDLYDESRAAQELAQRMGLELLPQEAATAPATAAVLKRTKRTTDGVVIRIDWDAIRRKVVMQRQQETGAD